MKNHAKEREHHPRDGEKKYERVKKRVMNNRAVNKISCNKPSYYEKSSELRRAGSNQQREKIIKSTAAIS